MATSNHQLKQDYVFRAKIAEEAKLYNDMFDYACRFVFLDPTLTLDERCLFCSACNSVIQSLRSSLDHIGDYEEQANKSSLAKEIYTTTIKVDIINGKVLNILKDYLIPGAGEDMGAKLNYLTIEGDFFRYLAEAKEGKERYAAIGYAEKAYLDAKKIAEDYFTPIDKYRLAVALNLSVLYYDSLGDKDRAIRVSKDAFHDAMIFDVSEERCEDSFMVLSAMKDNLSNWIM